MIFYYYLIIFDIWTPMINMNLLFLHFPFFHETNIWKSRNIIFLHAYCKILPFLNERNIDLDIKSAYFGTFCCTIHIIHAEWKTWPWWHQISCTKENALVEPTRAEKLALGSLNVEPPSDLDTWNLLVANPRIYRQYMYQIILSIACAWGFHSS